MIYVDNVTMNYRIQQENIKSIKEYLVNVLRGKISYKEFCALNQVNLHINRGEVCGIVGRNGAGKSTLLKVIAGVLTPTSGHVQINGNIAPMLELGAGFDQDLTAKENIFLNGAILGYSKKFLEEKYDDIIEFSELKDFIDQPVRTFSSGMMMRLAFSIATLVEPEVLIVDEILSVGDFMFQQKCHQRMEQMLSGGTTLLFVSHDINHVKQLCKRAIWIDHGHLRGDGPAEEVCNAYVEAMERGE